MNMIDSLAQLIFNIYEAFTVALFMVEGSDLKCVSVVTFAQSFDRARLVPIESSLPGWVVKHGEPLIIPNFDKDAAALGYYGGDEDIKSFMAYPLESPGVIIVDSKKKYVFTDREKKILGNFASLVEQELERGKRLQDIEERNEELSVERRIIGHFRALGPLAISREDLLDECLAVAGGGVCFIGIEKKDGLVVSDASGQTAGDLKTKEFSLKGTVASMVIESGRELLLPYNSGYLRERPVLGPDDGLAARQFFGFPLVADEVPFGVLGFVATSDAGLREDAIGVLRDISLLVALHLSHVWMREYIERVHQMEPVTGSMGFTQFFKKAEEIVATGKRFCLISIGVENFRGYNRAMGVDAGDRLLKRLVQGVEYATGKNAFVTRSGSSRVLALARETGEAEVGNIVKILNYTVASEVSEQHLIPKNRIKVGVARCPEDGTDLWGLMDTAAERGEPRGTSSKGAHA